MARIIFFCLAFAYSGSLFAQVEQITATAKLLIGTKEGPINNRGPKVDSIILYAGGKPGQAWCGWTQVFIWKKCGIKSRGGGMASSWGVSLRRVPLFKVVNGDHFTIYNKYMGRVGHVGLVYNTFPEESFFKSFEGNINSHGARESSRSFAGCLMREYGCCCGFYRWWK